MKNKTILITGSSRGLGKNFALAFLEAGANVVLNGRNVDRLKSVHTEFKKSYENVSYYPFDVTNESEIDSNIESIEKNVGPIDVLVNCAGINIRESFLEMKAENWHTVLKTNLDGVFFVSQSVARRMAERQKGKIINICSLLSEQARAGIPAYTTSKGAVKSLTQAMAIDLAKFNIQVNGIGPGYFLTELNRDLSNDEKFNSWLLNRTPMGRWGKEEELNGVALFLASENSSFVTGQVIYVDGGLLASL